MKLYFPPAIWLAFLMIFSACSTQSRRVDLEKNGYFVAQCRVMDRAWSLKWDFPATLCHFFSDGTFLAGANETLAYYSSELKVLWEKKLFPHHMMNFTSRNTILVLASEWRPVTDFIFQRVTHYNADTGAMSVQKWLGNFSMPLDKKVRVDRVLELDLSGTIKKEFQLYGKPEFPFYHLNHIFGVTASPNHEFEVSHANSVYEIPPNRSTLPAFCAGNVIVNDGINRKIFILDADLKKVLWTLDYKTLNYDFIHDVKVLPNGHILFFKNRSLVGSREFSSLEEVDPVRRKVVWEYTENPKTNFYSHILGSVQLLDNDQVLYTSVTDNKTRTKIVLAKRSGAILWTKPLNSLFQGAYLLDLHEFLQNVRVP